MVFVNTLTKIERELPDYVCCAKCLDEVTNQRTMIMAMTEIIEAKNCKRAVELHGTQQLYIDITRSTKRKVKITVKKQIQVNGVYTYTI